MAPRTFLRAWAKPCAGARAAAGRSSPAFPSLPARRGPGGRSRPPAPSCAPRFRAAGGDIPQGTPLAAAPAVLPPARPYLLRFLGASGEAGAGALRQRAEAGGRAGEALLAQLPHGVPRRRLAGSKAGGAQPRPGRSSRRAGRPVPQRLDSPLTFSRLCRAANSPSPSAAILPLSAEAGAELPLLRRHHLGAVS